MMNGDISRSPSQSGTLEETLQQMNILIQENRDLKGKSGRVVVGSELRKTFYVSAFCLPLLHWSATKTSRVKGQRSWRLMSAGAAYGDKEGSKSMIALEKLIQMS